MELVADQSQALKLVRALDGLARHLLRALVDAFDFDLRPSEAEQRLGLVQAIVVFEETASQGFAAPSVRRFGQLTLPPVVALSEEDIQLYREVHRDSVLAIESLRMLADGLHGGHVRGMIEAARRVSPDLGQRLSDACVRVEENVETARAALEASIAKLEDVLDSHDADRAIDEHSASPIPHEQVRKLVGLA